MQNTFFRWNISKSRLLNGPRTPSTMSCPHCHLAQYTIDLNVCCKQKYQLLDVHSISISPPVHTTINIQQKTLVQQTLYAKNFWDTNEMKKVLRGDTNTALVVVRWSQNILPRRRSPSRQGWHFTRVKLVLPSPWVKPGLNRIIPG